MRRLILIALICITTSVQAQNSGTISGQASDELSSVTTNAANDITDKLPDFLKETIKEPNSTYTVGVDDVLDIAVMQPEQIISQVTVTPDGSISFPYVGNLLVKGMTINEVQQEIEKRLSDGYLKYPSVLVTLRESRSRKFSVYGEVNRPGSYPMDENCTVLRAISMAGGFTRFGSASRVKLLRQRENLGGYQSLQINIKAVMDGDSKADVKLKPGDILVVSEGLI